MKPNPEAIHPENICSEIPLSSNADQAFINAIKDFDSVILLETHERSDYRATDKTIPTTLTVRPFERLSKSAAATAPFLLPAPALGHLEHVNGESDCKEKTLTLPMQALKIYNKEINKQAEIKTDTLDYKKALNYYGPPGSIPCRSYQSILIPEHKADTCIRKYDHNDIDFSGKVVFIGYADFDRPTRIDSYRTVYSGNDGVGHSGVEILATAFANLSMNTSLRKPGIINKLLIVSFFGITLGFLVRIFSPLIAINIGIITACLYMVIAYITFTDYYLVLPIITPILIQVPVAILLASLINYYYERIAREILQRITGYRIPQNEIDQFTNSLQPTDNVYDICMATDMKDSTSLVEKLGTKKFEELMDAYYRIIANIIKQHGGYTVGYCW